MSNLSSIREGAMIPTQRVFANANYLGSCDITNTSEFEYENVTFEVEGNYDAMHKSDEVEVISVTENDEQGE